MTLPTQKEPTTDTEVMSQVTSQSGRPGSNVIDFPKESGAPLQDSVCVSRSRSRRKRLRGVATSAKREWRALQDSNLRPPGS
jgi:hypothetical protein